MKNSLTRLPYYFKRFFQSRATNQLHIVIVTIKAIYYRLCIIILPRKVVYSWLGVYQKKAHFCTVVSPESLRKAQQLGRFVENLCNRLPINASCLVQSLIIRRYLDDDNIPYLIHVGLAKKSNNKQMQLSAHAWVCVGPLVVTGGKFFREFTVLSTYVPKALSEMNFVSMK